MVKGVRGGRLRTKKKINKRDQGSESTTRPASPLSFPFPPPNSTTPRTQLKLKKHSLLPTQSNEHPLSHPFLLLLPSQPNLRNPTHQLPSRFSPLLVGRVQSREVLERNEGTFVRNRLEHVEGWDFVFGRLVVGFEGGGRTERGEERRGEEGRTPSGRARTEMGDG